MSPPGGESPLAGGRPHPRGQKELGCRRSLHSGPGGSGGRVLPEARVCVGGGGTRVRVCACGCGVVVAATAVPRLVTQAVQGSISCRCAGTVAQRPAGLGQVSLTPTLTVSSFQG